MYYDCTDPVSIILIVLVFLLALLALLGIVTLISDAWKSYSDKLKRAASPATQDKTYGFVNDEDIKVKVSSIDHEAGSIDMDLIVFYPEGSTYLGIDQHNMKEVTINYIDKDGKGHSVWHNAVSQLNGLAGWQINFTQDVLAQPK